MKYTGKTLSLILINCVLFLLVIILVEGTFRIAGIPYKIRYIPNENSFARFNPELGWSYIPNNSSIHTTGHIVKQVHFDSNGARVSDPDVKLDYTKPSILFIGGSFTMGHGLSYEDSFVGKVNASDEVPYQIVNLGVQGYGSDQALLSLKKYISKFNAKIVVYTFIGDHIYRNGSYDRRMLVPTAKFLGTKPQFMINSDKKLYLARKPLLYKDYMHSYLFDFLKMRIGKLSGKFPPFPVELTGAIIQEMQRYSNKHNAHFVILNWRWSINDHDELFHDLAGIEVIDTMEAAPKGWVNMVILEGIHPNAKASDHAAGLLLDYFRENGLLQNSLDK